MEENTVLMDQPPSGIYGHDPGNTAQFEAIFKSHFKGMHAYATTLVRDSVAAEEIVQNIFFRLWEKSDRIEIRESLTGYLYRSLHYEGLNHLKHLKVRETYQSYMTAQEPRTDSATAQLELHEIQDRLAAALNELPEKCRTIFQMSRFDELKYQEIADKLEIPVKTVENQMGKALKLLRAKLIDFLPLLLMPLGLIL